MAGSPNSFPQIAGEGWVFTNLATGQDYQVIVEAEGYQTAYEDASLPPLDNASSIVLVYMKPIGQKNEFRKPKGQFVLAPRAEKEVERGLKDLRSRKFDSAEKHLAKALQMAPGNPYANYVMGMIYFFWERLPQAEQYLAKSVSIDPREPPALLALGTVQLQLNDKAGAIQALSQDVQLDVKSWKGEWLLANTYLSQGNYAQARDFAERALATGKAEAAPAELILGDALAGLGEREKAISTFQDYLDKYPNDSRAAQIREYVARLEKSPGAVTPVAERVATPSGPSNVTQPAEPAPKAAISASPPPVELPPKANWAPPDVDAAKPFIISGAGCSLPKVMKAAAKSAEEFVSTLERFSATEEYQSVEIKRDEQLETPQRRTYNYLVLVENPNPHLIQMDEFRGGNAGANNMPGLLADLGTPALALAFHPIFSGAFNWTCEGLGEWNGKSAWVIHFEQRADRPTSLLQAFETASKEYALPLKGRAWVTENGGEIMHLDTDLTRPVKEIGMMREHFSIDYAPVTFQTHKVRLWLPQDADVYYQYQGHYIHHYHHYSDFKLFWVGTKQKDSKTPYKPKNKSRQ
ncbi:MAG TPA: tetratricopeptide repeat protein [Candidatus Acidoferrales bacterium]|nr:tetratricopeptide repeat protein [Candidatus Acidoferrales bacterium]